MKLLIAIFALLLSTSAFPQDSGAIGAWSVNKSMDGYQSPAYPMEQVQLLGYYASPSPPLALRTSSLATLGAKSAGIIQ
jgi:hypothetical protein